MRAFLQIARPMLSAPSSENWVTSSSRKSMPLPSRSPRNLLPTGSRHAERDSASISREEARHSPSQCPRHTPICLSNICLRACAPSSSACLLLACRPSRALSLPVTSVPNSPAVHMVGQSAAAVRLHACHLPCSCWFAKPHRFEMCASATRCTSTSTGGM
jgi:hypothetical protein